MNWLFLWMLLSLVPGHDEMHAIYISVIEADVTAHNITVEVKVFEDDLQDALRPFSGEQSKEDLLINYFRTRLLFGNETTPILKDHWQEGDSYRIRLIYEVPPNWPEVSVQASYFMELFPTQQNILKLSFEGEKAYHIFKKQDDTFVTSFSH